MTGEPTRPRHPAERWTADLQPEGSGRWDAARVAEALGVPLTTLAAALGETASTVARSPASDRLQPQLTAFGRIAGMLRQTFGGDRAKVFAWLREAQPTLGGLTPLDAMLRPGAAPAVEQWLMRAWLGEPE